MRCVVHGQSKAYNLKLLSYLGKVGVVVDFLPPQKNSPSSSQAYYVLHFKEKNAARPPFHCDSYTIRHNTKMVVEVVLGIADLVTVLSLDVALFRHCY